MFKKLAIASVLSAAMLGGPGFAANSVSSNFDVKITLTSACKVVATDAAIALNYTAFQTEAAKDDAEFSVSCTSGQQYSLALQSPQTSYTDAETGLAYSLNLGTVANTTGTAGSTPTQTGDGNAKSFYVTGTIDKGLAGKTSESSTPIQHTLVVSY